LPDGPSGRNPIACAQVVRQPVSEAYLVLFDDGTLGTKINEEFTPLQRRPSKSFDVLFDVDRIFFLVFL
jgi:hypothetical protein